MNRLQIPHDPHLGSRRPRWKPDAEEDRDMVAFVSVWVFWLLVGLVFALANLAGVLG